MNWHKRLLIKVAAAASKIQRYGIIDPSVKFFIHKYENSIPWDKVEQAKKTGNNPQDVINNFISSTLLPDVYKKIDPQSDDNNYTKHYDVQGRYEAAIADNPDNPPAELVAAYRIYQQDPEGAEKKLLGIINREKESR